MTWQCALCVTLSLKKAITFPPSPQKNQKKEKSIFGPLKVERRQSFSQTRRKILSIILIPWMKATFSWVGGS